MPQIFAVWHGGSSYSGGGTDEHVEMFNSTAQAVAACNDRHVSGHWKPQEFDFVNSDSQNVLTPCVDETASMDVYLSDPTGDPDPYPDFRIEWDEKLDRFTEQD